MRYLGRSEGDRTRAREIGRGRARAREVGRGRARSGSYWIESSEAGRPLSTSRPKSETSSPRSRASELRTVGGSCLRRAGEETRRNHTGRERGTGGEGARRRESARGEAGSLLVSHHHDGAARARERERASRLGGLRRLVEHHDGEGGLEHRRGAAAYQSGADHLVTQQHLWRQSPP